MSGIFIVLAFVVAVNAPRRRLALPEPSRAELAALAAGFAVALALAAAGVLVAEPFLDAIDVAPESFEIAAGLVVVVAGAWALVFPRPEEMPWPSGWMPALVPVAFPLLLNAEVVALVIALGALEDAAGVIAGAAVGFASLVALALLRDRPAWLEALWLGLARLSGVGLVAVGVQLIVEGVRDV